MSATAKTQKLPRLKPRKIRKRATAKVEERPAETLTFGGAVALGICLVVGVRDPVAIGVVGVLVAGIPSAVTWLVDLKDRASAR